MSNADPKAQHRMNVILRSLSGDITATQGAKELNVSRKTFHSWVNRALTGLHESLKDKPTGRPEKEFNPYVEEVEKKNAHLQRQVLMLEQEREIRDILQGELRHAFEDSPSEVQKKSIESKSSKNKRRKKKKGGGKY